MRRRRVFVALLVTLVALLATGAIVIPRLVDADRLLRMGLVQARAATGYAIDADRAEIGWGFRGISMRVRELRASAPDGSQEIGIRTLEFHLKTLPLLRRRVELASVTVKGLDWTLRDGEASAPGDGAASSGPAASPDSPAAHPLLGVLAVERWRVEEGRFTRLGEADTLTFSDVTGEGDLSLAAGAGGTLAGGADLVGGVWRGAGWSLPVPDGRISWSARFPSDMTLFTIDTITASFGPLAASGDGEYRMRDGGVAGELRLRGERVAWSGARSALPPEHAGGVALLGESGWIEIEDIRIAQAPENDEVAVALRMRFGDFAPSIAADPPMTAVGGTVSLAAEGSITAEGNGRLGEDTVSFRFDGTRDLLAGAPWRVRVEAPLRALGAAVPDRLTVREGVLRADLTVTGAPPYDLEHIPAARGSIVLEHGAGRAGAVPLTEGSVRLRMDGHEAHLERAYARLDGAPVTVTAHVTDVRNPFVEFIIRADRLDADALSGRPLPAVPAGAPPSSPPGEPPPGAGDPSAAAVVAPTPLILPGAGRIEIGELRTHGQTLRDVAIDVRLDEAGLRMDVERMLAYGGAMEGSLVARPLPRGDVWGYDGNFSATDVRAGDLLAATPLGARLDGLLRSSVTLRGEYRFGASLLAGLDAEAAVAVRDGAFQNLPEFLELGRTLGLRAAGDERWPFRDLAGSIRIVDGGVVLDSTRVRQLGAEWRLAGRVGFDGSLVAGGTVFLEAARVRLPDALQPFVKYLRQPDGTIPVDFALRGTALAPVPVLDWESLAKRAAGGARQDAGETVRDAVEEALEDAPALDPLKKLFGGKKNPPAPEDSSRAPRRR